MNRKLQNLIQTEIDPVFAKRSEFIFKEVYKKKPAKVLDAGCGRGFYVHALTAFPFIKKIYGVDIDKKYIEIAKKNSLDKRVVISKASLYTLPYSDNYFDFIICSEVLEHLERDYAALVELKRVLKKNGTLIITVPNYHFPFFWDPLNWILMRRFNTHIPKDIWWLAGIWADHDHLYTKEKLVNVVSKCGFKIKEVKLIVSFCWPFSHFILYGIGKNIVERFNIKSLNRFQKNRGILSSIIALIFKFPTIFENKNLLNSSVNIMLMSEK